MIGKYVVYQSTQVDRTNGGLVILLTTDTDTKFDSILVTNITINEQFGWTTPVITMDMQENGRVFADSKFDMSQKFYLSISESSGGTLNTMALRLSSVIIGNQSPQDAGRTNITATFVMADWAKMQSDHYIKSWTQRSPSNIVEGIVKDCGYTGGLFEDCRVNSNLVQYNTTNSEFIEYLSKNAVSIENKDRVEFGQRSNGEFLFTSVSGIIKHDVEKLTKKRIPLMILGQPISGISPNWKDNGWFPPRFHSFVVKDDYKKQSSSGSSGIRQSYFDFATGEYKVRKIGFDDLITKMLSKINSILPGDNSKTIARYYGSDTNAFSLQEQEVANSNSKNIILDVGCNFQPKAHIGHLINLMIPLVDMVGRGGDMVSTLYSGYYVVTGISHVIDVTSHQGITKLLVRRQGFDSGTQGVNSSGGRF